MAKVRVSGRATRVPTWPMQLMANSSTPSLLNTTTVDNTSKRVILSGHVWWEDGAEHDIAVIHWRVGAASGSSYTLRVSLRDTDLTAGPPGRDDGTVDQSATHTTGITSTAKISSTLDAARTTAHGDLLSVVWDLTAVAASSFSVSGLQVPIANDRIPLLPAATFFDGSTFSTMSTVPHITLEASDGAFGTMSMPRPDTITSVALTSSSNPRRVALEFTVPSDQWLGALAFLVSPASGGDFKLSLYDGSTEIVSRTIDANTWHTNAVRWVELPVPDQPLVVGTTYRIAIEATTANAVTVYTWDVTDAPHLGPITGGRCAYTPHDGTSWGSVVTTRVPLAAWGMTAIETGGGSGGYSRARVVNS
jgi:hypothetical protein